MIKVWRASIDDGDDWELLLSIDSASVSTEADFYFLPALGSSIKFGDVRLVSVA